MENEPIIVEEVLNAPIERVWKAITDKEELRHWFFDVSRFWPEAGFDFQFYTYRYGKKYVNLCRITDVIEKRKLSFTWRFEGYEGKSKVTIELTPADKQTLLKITHTGIESFPVTDPNFSYDHIITGWNNMIKKSLKDFAERDNINNSIKIHADAERVWDVLTEREHIDEWISTVRKGHSVEFDCREGAEVIWKNSEGDIIVKGIVTVNNPGRYLKIIFPCYDETSCSLNPGEDYQIYMLTAISRDQTLLEVESNTFTEHTSAVNNFWESALKKIKTIAEEIFAEVAVYD